MKPTLVGFDVRVQGGEIIVTLADFCAIYGKRVVPRPLYFESCQRVLASAPGAGAYPVRNNGKEAVVGVRPSLCLGHSACPDLVAGNEMLDRGPQVSRITNNIKPSNQT